jgi:hypothetical protein
MAGFRFSYMSDPLSPPHLSTIVRRNMIEEPDIALIEATDQTARWYVHSGFSGWSYGCPVDPTPITRTCALRLLKRMIQGRHPRAIELLAASPNALDYADQGDDLFKKTGGNRLIAYVNPDIRIFHEREKAGQDYDV